MVKTWVITGVFIFCVAFSSLSLAGELPKLSLDQAVAAAGPEKQAGAAKTCEPGDQGKPCEEAKEMGYQKPLKELSLSVNYYLWSDYIFRGVNMSEYAGEGREDLVHQMDVGGEWKFNKVFGVGGKFFASWFAGSEELYGTGRNIQELRYSPYLIADVEEIYSRLMLGFNFFNYPAFPPGRTDDMEWWFQICHNDAWLWKGLFPDNKQGVLNPFLFFSQNIDEAEGGCAWLLGGKHDFAIPCVTGLTLTPQMALATDHRLVGKLVADEPTTKLLFLQYGLTVGYNLSQALKLPPDVGNFTISGSLYFSDAFADYIHDEFYGGMQVGWSW